MRFEVVLNDLVQNQIELRFITIRQACAEWLNAQSTMDHALARKIAARLELVKTVGEFQIQISLICHGLVGCLVHREPSSDALLPAQWMSDKATPVNSQHLNSIFVWALGHIALAQQEIKNPKVKNYIAGFMGAFQVYKYFLFPECLQAEPKTLCASRLTAFLDGLSLPVFQEKFSGERRSYAQDLVNYLLRFLRERREMFETHRSDTAQEFVDYLEGVHANIVAKSHSMISALFILKLLMRYLDLSRPESYKEVRGQISRCLPQLLLWPTSSCQQLRKALQASEFVKDSHKSLSP